MIWYILGSFVLLGGCLYLVYLIQEQLDGLDRDLDELEKLNKKAMELIADD